MRVLNVFRLLWLANYVVNGSEVISSEENTAGDSVSRKNGRKLQYGNDYHDYPYHYRYEVTALPTPRPTFKPTPYPTPRPTPVPTPRPSKMPTPYPSPRPTPHPTPKPTPRPSEHPTPNPIPRPTRLPTPNPTPDPTPRPTIHPTPHPTKTPTCEPSPSPSEKPTNRPTDHPTEEPSNNPTGSEEPSESPTSSEEPSESPTSSDEPSENPTDEAFADTIAERICSRDDLERLCEFLGNVGNEFLDNANIDSTVFAPSDRAFRVFEDFVNRNPFLRDFVFRRRNRSLQQNFFDVINDTLLGYDIDIRGLIDYHIVRGEELLSEDLSCTGNDSFVEMYAAGSTQTLCRNGDVYGQAGSCQNRYPSGGRLPAIIESIQVSNGVIHIVDQVLLPSQNLDNFGFNYDPNFGYFPNDPSFGFNPNVGFDPNNPHSVYYQNYFNDYGTGFGFGCEVWGGVLTTPIGPNPINPVNPVNPVNPNLPSLVIAVCGGYGGIPEPNINNGDDRQLASEQFCTLVRRTIFEPDNPFSDVRPVTVFVPRAGVTVQGNQLLPQNQTDAIRRVLNDANTTENDRRLVVQFLQLHVIQNIITVNGLCGTVRPNEVAWPTLREGESVTVKCTSTTFNVRGDNNNGDGPRINPGDGQAINARYHFISNILSP